MKKIFALLLAVVMTLGLLAGCGTAAETPDTEAPATEAPAAEEPAKTGEAAPAKTIVLKLGHNSNAESMYNQGCEKFAQLVEEYTNGTVKVEIHNSGTLGAKLIGQDMMDKYGTWPMYSKFFDYDVPLFHHLHLDFQAAAKIGVLGKPEAYYYPPQYNNYAGSMPVTYFGFDPDCTKEEVRERLVNYEKEDIRITELSRAYRIELGTGWYTPPGVVHAPGSYLTYEPQWNSDVNSVFENVASGEVYSRDFLVENLPEEEKDSVDAVMDLMDWDANVDPHYKQTYFRPPVVASEEEGKYVEKWVVYGNPYIGAKELTVYPGQTVTIRDSGAYGCILTQGHGTIGDYECEAAGMLRFGQLSADEYFVGAEAAARGVTITNRSCEPLVMLKHFGPNHPEKP